MTRDLAEEKIKYLLFLYERKDQPLSVTAAAKACGVAKSTFSRTLSAFFEMGYVAEPGKTMLSPDGKKAARALRQEVDQMKEWLQSEIFLQGDLLEEEARRTVCALSTDTRKKLYSRHRLSIFFASLKSVTEIPGDRLCFQLPDGEYEFAFSIYKVGKEEAQLSMADQGFFHPGLLRIQEGKGEFFLKIREVEQDSRVRGMRMRGQVDSLSCFIHGDSRPCGRREDAFVFPIQPLDFFYREEERILQASVEMEFTCSVGPVHMPKSRARMIMIFK